MLNIVGYHGTSAESAVGIIKEGFKNSEGENEWIGKGTYFFIKGISSIPSDQALEWAIAEAWDNSNRINIYNRFAVIKSEIKVEEEHLLDLTIEDGVNILNYIIEAHKNKIQNMGRFFDYKDGYIIDFARGEGLLDIDVVKGNYYIKFAEQRKRGINLRTANCTICSVYEPNKNITSSTIVKEGDI
ncbi:hypothetical protein [Belliella aquatica]|uniref:Uncharacterized protein n=1 Tax=Belliella aquatica TaxID=1323734 RepID=A0ABQ1LX45_9BACT|nr:hypothetical protein [Belliella aquatica]MCH7407286.1 hypothetical protein [Belliella aquatica]GGC31469.1 hypothetical protein GCM10010993_08030 [Belliella aquatica]